ncbi:hypothetical protein [Erythrobacter mangrovi]|uniref:Uncharacterized protein n=1 Tax=Erythrobacter mangrovi TaxID=2739433 RepID=A0A7D3XAG9_9SPHN|nr:hypothetical protein [Erythrobacter mangrovi]QKG70850.1 hypothetical protein HQR01_05390 [Erythrobacter mangrovi]
MKPSSIKNFDRLYIGSIVVGLIGFFFSYGAAVEQVSAELPEAGAGGLVSGGLIIGLVVGTAISLALWFLISVLRIELMKWILAIIAAFGILGLFVGLGSELATGTTQAFNTLSTLLSIAAIFFLFQPDAKAWFAEKRGG